MSTMPSSLRPRLTTALTLTGMPAAAAASIPSSTRDTGKSTSFIARKMLVVERVEADGDAVEAASASAGAFAASSDAFVVSASSAPSGAAARSASPRLAHERLAAGSRSFGDPEGDGGAGDAHDLLEGQQLLPLQEAVVAPEDDWHAVEQRKLQRSVTEMRRSRSGRPSLSTVMDGA